MEAVLAMLGEISSGTRRLEHTNLSLNDLAEGGGRATRLPPAIKQPLQGASPGGKQTRKVKEAPAFSLRSPRVSRRVAVMKM